MAVVGRAASVSEQQNNTLKLVKSKSLIHNTAQRGQDYERRRWPVLLMMIASNLSTASFSSSARFLRVFNQTTSFCAASILFQFHENHHQTSTDTTTYDDEPDANEFLEPSNIRQEKNNVDSVLPFIDTTTSSTDSMNVDKPS